MYIFRCCTLEGLLLITVSGNPGLKKQKQK